LASISHPIPLLLPIFGELAVRKAENILNNPKEQFMKKY
jgi:hypothetical protein